MAKYSEIQEYTKDTYGVNIETCWIAHVKEMHNLVDMNYDRKKPCPKDKVEVIEKTFKHFGMI